MENLKGEKLLGLRKSQKSCGESLLGEAPLEWCLVLNICEIRYKKRFESASPEPSLKGARYDC